jgi:nucleoside-specific outer membrane channel protein Tsx
VKKSIRSTLFSTLKALTVAALLSAPLAVADQAHAGAAAWQSTNFQYLWGSSFENPFTGSKHIDQSTITVEHADGWKYGDNFFFFDITSPTDDDAFIYGEISPRLSLGKITGMDLSAPFVKDVLLAGTYEIASSGDRGYLYGVGLSLNLPKFNFADLNLYARNTSNNDGITYQITPVWQLPFTIGKADLLFEGFVDFAGSEGASEFNIDAQPRLLLDAGKLWGAPGNLYLGTEVIYWHNKFGIDGVNEFAPQVMVKWVL